MMRALTNAILFVISFSFLLATAASAQSTTSGADYPNVPVIQQNNLKPLRPAFDISDAIWSIPGCPEFAKLVAPFEDPEDASFMAPNVEHLGNSLRNLGKSIVLVLTLPIVLGYLVCSRRTALKNRARSIAFFGGWMLVVCLLVPQLLLWLVARARYP